MDGVDVQYLCALDKKTGATIWRTDRNTEFDDLGADGKPVDNGDYRKSYTTPLLGRELWRTTYKGFSNASLPAWIDGTLAINTGHGKANLQAFSISGSTSGDLTGKLLWEQTKNIPTRSSPVVAAGLIFLVSDPGLISAVDPKDGNLLFSERTSGNTSASPLAADGKLFFCSERGATTVVIPGRSFQKAAVNQLDSGIMASPAAVGRSLFIRTKTHLYCLENPQ